MNNRCFAGCTPSMGVNTDNEGADVQGSSFGMGNPVLIHGNQFCNRLCAELLVNRRDAETVVRNIQTSHVAVRAEQQNPAIHSAVSLHTLKTDWP